MKANPTGLRDLFDYAFFVLSFTVESFPARSIPLGKKGRNEAEIMKETQAVEYKESWNDEYLKRIAGMANAGGFYEQ